MKIWRPEYLNGFTSITFAKIFRYSILIVANSILAKSFLSTTQIGTYEKFLFFVALTSSFWVNGLLNTFLTTKKEELKTNYFNYAICFQTLGIISALLLITINQTTHFLNFSVFQITLLALFTSIQSPTYTIEYIYLNENKDKNIIKYSLINYSCWLLAISIPLCLNKGVNEILIGLLFYSVLKYCWLVAIIKKHGGFVYNTNYIKNIFVRAKPLLLLTTIGGIGLYTDGLIVSYTQTKEMFAIFSYGSKELPIALILATTLDQIYVTKLINTSNKVLVYSQLKKQGERVMHVMFPITILLLFTSPYLFETVFNTNFKSSSAIFNIYLLLLISRVFSPQTITLANHKKKALITASVIEVVCNITLSLLLYRHYGIAGIVFATVIAFVLEKVLLVIYNQKKLHIKFKTYTNIPLLVFYSFLLVGCYCYSVFI